MVNLGVDLMEEAAYHKGKTEGLDEAIHILREENNRLREQERQQPKNTEEQRQRTYATALTNGENNRQREQISELRDQGLIAITPQKKDEQRIKKEGLLIYPPQVTENPHHKVSQMLKTLTTPHELGLTAIEIRPVRGGAVVLSPSKEGLDLLEEKISTDPKTTGLFQTRRTERRHPQIAVMGVDPDLEPERIIDDIVKNNNITAETTDLKIVRRFDNRESDYHHRADTNSISPGYSKGKTHRRMDNVSGPGKHSHHEVYKVLQIWPQHKDCRGDNRCSECAGNRPYTRCHGEIDDYGYPLPNRCPGCYDMNQKNNTAVPTYHSFYDKNCYSLEAEREKIRKRTKYT